MRHFLRASGISEIVDIFLMIRDLIPIMVAIIVVKCCCMGRSKKPAAPKPRPDIVHSTHQPPAYGGVNNYGIENKGVDTVKDVNDDANPLKNNIYSVQNQQQQGYDYNGASTYPNGGEAANTNNSNSNSANGGSVNSQDSLWNVKNGNATDPANFGYNPHPGDYPYDPMQQQQGYMPQQQQQQPEEYAHYPYPDEYLNERNQQYLNDHYGINPGQQQQQMNSMQQQMEGDCEYYFYFKSSIKTLDEFRNKIERSSHFVCLYSFNDIFQ